MLLFHTENLPHYGLERTFELAREAGFTGVTVAINNCYDTQTPAYLRKLENRYKLKIRAFSIAAEQEEMLTKAYQTTVREFPGSHLILSPPKTFGGIYKKWLDEIVPRLAHKYDLVVCRRNVPPQNLAGIIPQRQKSSLGALKEEGDICLDTSAVAIASQEIMRAIPFLGKQLRHVYLSNFYQEIPYSIPDRGILPLENFLGKLKEVKWKGYITLRVDPQQLVEGDDEKILDGMKRSIAFYKTYFKDAE